MTHIVSSCNNTLTDGRPARRVIHSTQIKYSRAPTKKSHVTHTPLKKGCAFPSHLETSPPPSLRRSLKRMSSDPVAERELAKLKRLEANKACANCGVVAKHGHGAVCMAYATFVCHTCKSAHQSYSHLCKSVSMSFWTKAEVSKLKNGGNARARAKWLARLGPSGSAVLPESPSLPQAKDFVRECYIERRWYDENVVVADEGLSAKAPPSTTTRNKPVASPATRLPKKIVPPTTRIPSKATPPAAVAAAPHKKEVPAKAAEKPPPPPPPTLDLLTFEDVISEPTPPHRPSSDQTSTFLDAFANPAAASTASDLPRAAPVDSFVQQPIPFAVPQGVRASSSPAPLSTSMQSLDPFSADNLHFSRAHSIANMPPPQQQLHQHVPYNYGGHFQQAQVVPPVTYAAGGGGVGAPSHLKSQPYQQNASPYNCSGSMQPPPTGQSAISQMQFF